METEEQEQETWRDKMKVIFHKRSFHVCLILLIVVDVIILFTALLVDLEVIPVSGDTAEEREHSREEIDHALHSVAIAIISVFVVEIIIRIIVFRKEFFKDKFYVFDAIVVFVSFILDIVLSIVSSSAIARDAAALLITMRLWRFLRLMCEINICVRVEVKEEYEEALEAKHRAQRERDFYYQELSKYTDVEALKREFHDREKHGNHHEKLDNHNEKLDNHQEKLDNHNEKLDNHNEKHDNDYEKLDNHY